MRAPTADTLQAFGEAWVEKAEREEVLSRRRTPYKPSVLRGYRHDLEVYGGLKLADFSRYEAQALVDDLVSRGFSGSKVRNVIVPLQALYRYAKKRGKRGQAPAAHP